MKQIKVRRGIDIAQSLFQNITLNRGRSQPPRAKEANLKQQDDANKLQTADDNNLQRKSPWVTDQNSNSGRVGGQGSRSIIVEQLANSKHSGGRDSRVIQPIDKEQQRHRMGINQSVAHILTLSQLNSEGGSVQDHPMPASQRPSAPALSPQRVARKDQRQTGMFDRISVNQKSQLASQKQKGGSSVQPSLRYYAGARDSQSSVVDSQTDQITSSKAKRSARNFESKLGNALRKMNNAGSTVSHEGGDSQSLPSGKQKIVNVARSTEKKQKIVKGNRQQVSEGSQQNKVKKAGQKAVVNKYQQIPQSMISNHRPTFQQLEQAQSLSSLSDRFVGLTELENDKTMRHIRQHYQEENYRSSPGNQKTRDIGKETPVIKNFMVPSASSRAGSKGGLQTGTDRHDGVLKVPCSPAKPKTKAAFGKKPPQLGSGEDRDHLQSPQFTQTRESGERQRAAPSDGTSPTPDIESQSQHMQQWRRDQFQQDQSEQSQGVQNYKVRNLHAYPEDGESMNVNNTNMIDQENDIQRLQRPTKAQAHQKPSRPNLNHASKKQNKLSVSSPKPSQGDPQDSVQSTDKPRTQSYYQRILSYAKTSKRSPKTRQEGKGPSPKASAHLQIGPLESGPQALHSKSGVNDPSSSRALHIQPTSSRGLDRNRKHNDKKIPSKHASAVQLNPGQFAYGTSQQSVGNLHQSSMCQESSQMKTIPVNISKSKNGSIKNTKSNFLQVDDDQRVSDLFSPARGQFEKRHQTHNTMTQSQIQNMKNSTEGLKAIVGDIPHQDSDVNRRYTKVPSINKKDFEVSQFDGQTENRSHQYKQSRDFAEYYEAQSAMSPTRQIRMYDQMLQQTPSQTFNGSANYRIKTGGIATSSQRSIGKGTITEGTQMGIEKEPSFKFQSSNNNKSSEKNVSQGSNYAIFNFRRKQGAIKSNERPQSPRASSKQIMAKQNLSKLTKPFTKQKASEKRNNTNDDNITPKEKIPIGLNHTDDTGMIKFSEQTPRDTFIQKSSRFNSQQTTTQAHQVEGLIKKVNSSQQQLPNNANEHGQQSSIIFGGSSRDSCDIDNRAGSRDKNIRIVSDSYSPPRPAINKFNNKHDHKIEKQPTALSANEQRGVNADFRIRNKRNFVSNIRQAHQNYINNKLKKMESNNVNKLQKQQQSDTPPRTHTSKFSMDVSDRDYISNDFNTTSEKTAKVRTTFNSSKFKDQETASGATKQNSAYLQASMQGQQIGDGGIDEKDGTDDMQIQEDPEQEVKGWAIFKLKSWKNIFAKSNEKTREDGQEIKGDNIDTKEVQVDNKKQDETKEEKDKPKEAPAAIKQKSATSHDGQVVMELKEVKHHIQCDCDKDPTYQFACKNGVVWFAANVIMLKIRRQQKLNDKVDVSKIILDEYEKCKKHYKSLKKLKPKQESALQIDRDLGRTFPKNEFFQPGQPGHKKLRNVLRAFSCYDDQADYVQGMNFLVGQLLMHCSATLAFWLFVELIEECELRDIYQVGLPGLHKHSFIINMLVKDHLPDLHKHFEEHNVVPEMYASDWIFGLFASILPENQTKVTANFFSLFFQYKWEFFYKLILSILEHLKPKLLESQDMFSILQQIKIAMSNKNDPYTYGLIYQQEQQMQGQQKNRNKYTDHEMEDILGSIVSGTDNDEESQHAVQAHTSLFSNIANFFKKSKDEGEREPVWQEFPWEQVIVKTDIIQKWKKVDMKKINRLHANFDLDTGKFVNIDEERQQQEQQAKLGAAIATSLDKHQYNSKE